MSNKPTYLQERVRCLRLVEAYRERIELWMNKPGQFPESVSAALVAEKIASSLRRIETEIKSPRDRKGSDFSIDELERAQAIINEQNRNPFEG
jgi:hypothetical protein